MSQERPAVVTAAVWLVGVLIALSVITAVLAIVLQDELMDAWASGKEDAGSIEPPSIVPVAVVMLVVVALLVVVLLEFFRARHGWARPTLTAIVVLFALATLATLRIGPPAAFVVLGIASLVVDVLVVVTLWHRDTTAYLRTEREHVTSV